MFRNNWGYSKNLLNSFNDILQVSLEFFKIHNSLKVSIIMILVYCEQTQIRLRFSLRIDYFLDSRVDGKLNMVDLLSLTNYVSVLK